jgi:hypothetical protein
MAQLKVEHTPFLVKLVDGSSMGGLKFWPFLFQSHIVQFWFDFLSSVHLLFHSGLIFSTQGENG